MAPINAYKELEKCFGQLQALKEASSMLHWDAATIMPKSVASAATRSEQISALDGICHEILNSNKISDLLNEAQNQSTLNNWQTANLREMKHMWTHSSAVTSDLVVALSKACMKCEIKWRSTRPVSDYDGVKPLLSEVLKLVKESAIAKSEVLNCTPYEALMDEYTPGLRQEIVDPIFSDIEGFLPDFLSAVLEKQAMDKKPSVPEGPFPLDQQQDLGQLLMETLGFDFDQGRLDVSLHPFSSGTPDDLRITTRYNEHDFMPGLMGILHETGHALYEKNLPKEWRRQPVGEARGMDIHESQSLLIEMQACRSKEFLSYAIPLMKEKFNKEGPEWEIDNLYQIYTTVKPGLIRVDADEVTYPAHVILRYNIEYALVTDKMTLNDLPTAWDEWMSNLLGLKPSNHENGCMQDIHWFDGAWGYFPSYSMGAITAAQFFNTAIQSDPNILPSISQGNFDPLYLWLTENIYKFGSLYETPELIQRATSKPLDPSIFKNHLTQRYLA